MEQLSFNRGGGVYRYDHAMSVGGWAVPFALRWKKCEWSERVVSVFIVELVRNQCEECSPSRENCFIVTCFNFVYHYECCKWPEIPHARHEIA